MSSQCHNRNPIRSSWYKTYKHADKNSLPFIHVHFTHSVQGMNNITCSGVWSVSSVTWPIAPYVTFVPRYAQRDHVHPAATAVCAQSQTSVMFLLLASVTSVSKSGGSVVSQYFPREWKCCSVYMLISEIRAWWLWWQCLWWYTPSVYIGVFKYSMEWCCRDM